MKVKFSHTNNNCEKSYQHCYGQLSVTSGTDTHTMYAHINDSFCFIHYKYLSSVFRPRSVYRPLNPLAPSRGEFFSFCFMLISSSTNLNRVTFPKPHNGTIVVYKDSIVMIMLFFNHLLFLLLF